MHRFCAPRTSLVEDSFPHPQEARWARLLILGLPFAPAWAAGLDSNVLLYALVVVLALACAMLVLRVAQLRRAAKKPKHNAADAGLSLTQVQKYLLSLVENSDEIILLYDVDGRCLYYNGARRYDRELSPSSKDDFAGFEPVTTLHLMAQIREVARKGTSMTVENCLYWKGRKRWFIDHIYPIPGENGTVQVVAKISREVTERKLVEQALRESEEQFRGVYHDSPIAIELFDSQGHMVGANKACLDLFGVPTESALLGLNLFEDPNIPESIRDRLFLGVSERFELVYDFEKVTETGYFPTNKAGTVHLDVLITPRTNRRSTRPEGYLVQVQNITWKKTSEQALRDSEQLFRALVENQGEGMAILDPGEHFVFANPMADQIFGVPGGQLVGLCLDEFTSPDQFAVIQALTQLQEEGRRETFEIDIQNRQSARRSLLVTATPWYEPGHRFGGALVIFHDITERKQMEEALKYLSSHDALTGLYNRAYFDQELARLQAGRRYPVSILMVDVDRLKVTNDQLGHAAGDDLLKRAALLLKNCFRVDDVVARIGGDEFCVLLPQTADTSAEESIKRLRETLADYNSTNPTVTVEMSIGLATAAAPCRLLDVLRLADERMYADKDARKERLANPPASR